MTVIWKFPVDFAQDAQDVQLPKGAQVLSAAVQHNSLTLWALVDEDAPLATRRLYVQATGAACPWPREWFVGVVFDGPYVWHLFLAPEGR